MTMPPSSTPDWQKGTPHSIHRVPRDYAKMLEAIDQCEGRGMGRDEAELEAFYAVTGGAR